MTPLIELRDVSRTFGHGKEKITAVDSISMAVEPGEIVCLVGESGCGKSTTGKIVAGLIQPTGGQILFQGRDIHRLDRPGYRRYRHAVQIVHQDPYASLNPTQTIRQILTTPLLYHGFAYGNAQAEREATRLLEVVDLTPPRDFLDKYPHQLSGGQRQRVSVARALTVKPSFLVADEAVSMVDVSLRVSLLKMLSRLRDELEVTFLFITHDLALAKYFAWKGRIVVMYLGRIVEEGPTPRMIQDPRHPYTQALLAAVPEADPQIVRQKQPVGIRSANIPSLRSLPPGCTFHPRCPFMVPGVCDAAVPPLLPVEAGGRAACPIINPEQVGALDDR
jgi:peptide/nickel transport system ATP-binding protein